MKAYVGVFMKRENGDLTSWEERFAAPSITDAMRQGREMAKAREARLRSMTLETKTIQQNTFKEAQ
jgi:hypothetical protein